MIWVYHFWDLRSMGYGYVKASCLGVQKDYGRIGVGVSRLSEMLAGLVTVVVDPWYG